MDKKASLIAILFLVVGAAIRCTNLFLIDIVHEPFRLGGLFVAFAEEIESNGFRLPVTIPYYSLGGIPFAYPPLGFYVEAVLLKIPPSQVFLVANLLPPLVSVLVLGLEWQPDEYDMVIQFNQVLEEAETWQELNGLVQLSDGQRQVYIVMGPRQQPGRADMIESDLLEIKINTPDLVVGVLDLR